MPEPTQLDDFQLVPVLELEPGTFSTVERESPHGSGDEVPEEWQTYWDLSLADAGITGLRPVRTGSWFVRTTLFSDQQLEQTLGVIFDDWGGISILMDPDSRPILNGGLALSSDQQDVFIEPTCCSDLGDIENWKVAAKYQGTSWEMLWIGHPWLSMKYQKPWLLLSEPHESEDPVARWAVNPIELQEAVAAAEAECIRLAKQISAVLIDFGFEGDPDNTALNLAGIRTEQSNQ